MMTGIIVAFITGCLLHISLVSGSTERDRLTRDLTHGYVSAAEPDPTPFKVGLSLICARYNKATNELVTYAWEKMTWTDKRLSWSPQEYAGINSIRLPSQLIWVPDIKLYNSLTPVEERDPTKVLITSEGTVIWIPTVQYKTLCSGEQTGSGLKCQLKLGSWTYDANILKLELSDKGIDLESYMNSTCPLAVDSATAKVESKTYPCCKEPYSHVQFDLHFKPQRV